MPFTFSHPAIVLPLTYLPRKWISLTGLIVGSLTPDFEYFLRMRIHSEFSHTFSGIFWFDLPMGLLLAFIFHNLVRNQLFPNLPKFLRARFQNFQDFNWNHYFKRHWMVVVLSILIGASSHVLWDSFTHDSGFFVTEIPSLTSNLTIVGFEIPVMKILQHLSSILGGLVVLYAVFKLPRYNVLDKTAELKYWILFTFIALTIIAIRLLSGLDYKLYGHVVVTAISAGMISLIITSLMMNLIKVKSVQNG